MSYIERFEVGGRVYGIEQPYPTKHRYKCWVGGCGIGEQNTLPAARQQLHIYAVRDQERQRDEAQKKLDEALSNLEKLGRDPFYLGRFVQEAAE